MNNQLQEIGARLAALRDFCDTTAEEMAKQGQLIKGEALNAVYHRLSQAERERMEKQKNT